MMDEMNEQATRQALVDLIRAAYKRMGKTDKDLQADLAARGIDAPEGDGTDENGGDLEELQSLKDELEQTATAADDSADDDFVEFMRGGKKTPKIEGAVTIMGVSKGTQKPASKPAPSHSFGKGYGQQRK